MANKPTQPIFPLGLEASEQSQLAGLVNNGVIEHGPEGVLTAPEGDAEGGIPSSVRYNPTIDSFEGYYADGGWLPLGGGGVRWEALPHASTATLSAGRGYLVDNSMDASTVVFPAPLRVGDSVTICDLYGKFSVYPLTIDPNGHALYGSTEPMTLSTDSMSATFTWSGDVRGWIITAGVGLGQGRVYSRSIYSNTLDAETTQVTLTNQPTIVDVYVDGKRLGEAKYSLDGYDVYFDPSLPSGSDLEIIQYVPIQLGAVGNGGSTGTVITWIYNAGVAVGGETSITLDIDAEDVSEIYVNGARQQKGLGFTYNSSTKVISLADQLDAGDEVVVVINGDPTLYNQIDRTPNEVARAANVPLSQVILSSDASSTLGSKTIVYDVNGQKSWGLPSGIPSNATIVSVSGSTLVYAPGNVTVTLQPVPGAASILTAALAANDGEKNVGICPSIATLRTIEPSFDGQIITLREHTAGTGKGGGRFRGLTVGTSYTDNNGTIIKTSGGRVWLRVSADVVNPLMFGAISGGAVDDSTAISRALAAANICEGLGLTYGMGTTVSMNRDKNILRDATLFCLGANPILRMRTTNLVVDNVIFDGNNKMNTAGIIWEGALTGVGGAVRNCTFKYLGYSGISVSGDYTNRIFANAGVIESCTFIECGWNGTANNRCSLLADGVNNFRIQGIQIKKANWGIYVRMDTGLADKARAFGNMVSDCYIQGCGRNHPTFTDAQGLSANRQDDLKVHNMIITDFADNGFDAGSSTGTQITNFRVSSCKDALFIGDISCNRYVVDNMIALDCDRGVRIVMDGTIYPVEQVYDVRLTNVHVYNPNWEGFYIGNTGAQTSVTGISLVNCSVNAVGSYSKSTFRNCYRIEGIQDIQLSNCNSAYAAGTLIYMDNCEYARISGGFHTRASMSGVAANAIHCTNSNRCSFTDMQIVGEAISTALYIGSGSGHSVKHIRWRSINTGLNVTGASSPYLLDNAAF